MSDEEIREVIPRIFDGYNNYSLIISSKRIAFIQTGSEYAILGGVVGGLVGGIIAKKYSKDEADFSNLNLDELISQKKNNKEIYINAITDIQLKKEIGSFRLIIYGYKKKNKVKKLLNWYIVPPENYIKEHKSLGLKQKDIFKKYVSECQEQIDRCLGHLISMRLDLH